MIEDWEPEEGFIECPDCEGDGYIDNGLCFCGSNLASCMTGGCEPQMCPTCEGEGVIPDDSM